jgi:hypothetical protein
LGGGDRKMVVQGPSRQKLSKTFSQREANTCGPSYSGGRGRRIIVQGQIWQKQETLCEKQIKAKRARGTGQMIGCFEALSLNPSNTGERERERERRERYF